MLGKLSAHLGPGSLFGSGMTPSLVLSLDAFGYTGSGTWSDLSSFNNDATSDGPISYSTDVGGCFDFDGTSKFIFGSVSGIPLENSHYTIETWFQSDSYGPSEQGTLIAWGGLSIPGYSNVLRLDGNGFINYWWANDIYATLSGSQSMITTNWYYVAVTYNGTYRRIYLNGVQVAVDTPIAPPVVNDMTTLKIGYDGINYFNGKISKVKVHSKSLSGANIFNNFNDDKIRHEYIFGSMVLDGSSSYIFSSSGDYTIGTNDFTLEGFFNCATYSDSGGILSMRDYSEQGLAINLTPSGNLRFMIQGSYLDTATISTNEWYHVALSRVGGTTSCYINGEFECEFGDLNNYTGQDLVVGRYYTNYDDYYLNGLASNVRLVNGTGLYSGTSSFTIPETPLQSTAQTELLITSQKTSVIADVSGNLHSVTSSNIGWTSSIPTFSPSYITDGLQFYVDAALSESYPGTGTTWYDISGNARNLTMINGLTYSSNNGGYIIFDSAQSQIADSVSTYAINFANGFTVECVAKFSGLGSEGLFAFNTSGSGDYINIQAQGNNVRWEVDQGQSFTSTGSLSSNTWYHITCVYEGDSNGGSSGTGRIYVNGIENASEAKTSNRLSQAQTSNFVLGLHDGYLNGNIALSRMYNKVLNASEVLQNFNSTKDRYGL